MNEHADAGGPVDRSHHVDEEMFDEIFSVLGGESLEGLLRACELFRKSVPARLAEIDTALAERRYETVVTAAHSLRGTAGAFGARRLSDLASRLEHLSHEGDRDEAGPLVEDMRGEFLLFRNILDARLDELTSRPR